MEAAKHPDIRVKLAGEDGNAYAILGRVCKAMRRGGVSPEDIKTYQSEAKSGDYDNLLVTTMEWVSCE